MKGGDKSNLLFTVFQPWRWDHGPHPQKADMQLAEASLPCRAQNPSLGHRGTCLPLPGELPSKGRGGGFRCIHGLSKGKTCLGLTTESIFYRGSAEGSQAPGPAVQCGLSHRAQGHKAGHQKEGS